MTKIWSRNEDFDLKRRYEASNKERKEVFFTFDGVIQPSVMLEEWQHLSSSASASPWDISFQKLLLEGAKPLSKSNYLLNLPFGFHLQTVLQWMQSPENINAHWSLSMIIYACDKLNKDKEMCQANDINLSFSIQVTMATSCVQYF